MRRVRLSFGRPRTIRFHDTASSTPRQAPLPASRECVSTPENKDFCNFTGGFSAPMMGAELPTTLLGSRAFINVTIEQRRADMTARAIAAANYRHRYGWCVIV